MICTVCGTKGLKATQFNRDGRKKNGLRSECKDCQRKRARAYRRAYYAKNRNDILDYQAKWYRKKINQGNSFC